jgi:hypothetical protein
MILVAIWLWEISPERNRRLGVVASSLLLSLTGVACFWVWRDIPHRQAIRGAMAQIENQTGSSGVVLVRSPLDFVVAKYYGSRSEAAGLCVRLWPEKTDEAGDAGHLITAADYYQAANFREQSYVWVIEPTHTQSPVLAPLGGETVVYESDFWLDAWSVKVGQVLIDHTRH